MDINSLIGKTFSHFSYLTKKDEKWTVEKINADTMYVYVQKDVSEGTFGQWIPAEWIEPLLGTKKLKLKMDSLRKSRDYFRNERDDLNKRIVSISASKHSESAAMMNEIEFLRTEMDLLESDVRFWKVFTIGVSITGVVLLAALWIVRSIYC